MYTPAKIKRAINPLPLLSCHPFVLGWSIKLYSEISLFLPLWITAVISASWLIHFSEVKVFYWRQGGFFDNCFFFWNKTNNSQAEGERVMTDVIIQSLPFDYLFQGFSTIFNSWLTDKTLKLSRQIIRFLTTDKAYHTGSRGWHLPVITLINPTPNSCGIPADHTWRISMMALLLDVLLTGERFCHSGRSLMT